MFQKVYDLLTEPRVNIPYHIIIMEFMTE